MDAEFETVALERLEELGPHGQNELPFGVVGFGSAGLVETYNTAEAGHSGLDPARVIGESFFEVIGQCMNNFMVAQRFVDEPELDAVLPYVLTFRMRPTRVRLRLLALAGTPRRFVLIER